jgi:L-threonylcarbamoyladenylate synthase
MPRILKIDPQKADYLLLKPAVETLLKGGVVAGPTETFYGLMALSGNAGALERVSRLKGRPADKPFLLLLDTDLRVVCYARNVPKSVEALAQRFWPGPLTLLLKAHLGLHPLLIGPQQTVALRVEGLPAVRILVRATDRAVTGTSANPSGQPPAATAEEVAAYFGDGVDLVLDAGRLAGGQPSTLVDVTTIPPRLVRAGVIGLEDLRAVTPDLRA